MLFHALNSYDITGCVCVWGTAGHEMIFKRHLWVIHVDKCISKAREEVASGVFLYLVHFHIKCEILKSRQKDARARSLNWLQTDCGSVVSQGVGSILMTAPVL